LLIVGGAPAIAVATGVFIATMAARGGSKAPAALLLPLTPQCRQTSAAATKPAAVGVLPASLPPHCQHCRHASRRRAAAALANTATMLPAADCRHRTAAKLPPMPPLLTLYLSFLSSFPLPLLLPLLVDC
jgi:hypothetical protein